MGASRRQLLAAVLALAGAATVVSSGCAALNPDDRQATLDVFLRVPRDARQALKIGDISYTAVGALGEGVRGDAPLLLAVDERDDITAGPLVEGCRAMVKALAPTTTRLYGRLHDSGALFEATDELCQRGLGLDGPTGTGFELALGDRSDGGTTRLYGVTVSAAHLHATARDGSAETVAAVARTPLGQLDDATSAQLPVLHQGDADQVFDVVLPEGTTVTATLQCSPSDSTPETTELEVEYPYEGVSMPSDFLTRLLVQGRDVREGPVQTDRVVSCDAARMLTRNLLPTLRYETAEGRAVDRYLLMASAGFEGARIAVVAS